MNRVLSCIQQNLDQPLTLQTLAAQACFSPYHFHRIFSAFTGETLHSYIRRLRLENAANLLRHTQRTVTDIAFDSGYETPGAFTKAFKNQFGTGPSAFRNQRTVYKPDNNRVARTNQPKEINMTPEIRQLEDQQVLYVRKTGPYAKAAGSAWRSLCFFAGPRRLLGPDTLFIGVSYDDPDITAAKNLRYDACISFTRDVKPRGKVGIQTLAGGRYAVFLHKGPYEKLSETYDVAFGQWLPQSGEELREDPCFELYLNDARNTPPAERLTEIHIPIK